MDRLNELICRIQALAYDYGHSGWGSADLAVEIIDVFEEYFDMISGKDDIDKRVVSSMIGIMASFEGNQGYMEPEAFNSGQEMYLYFVHVVDDWKPAELKNMWRNSTSESSEDAYKVLTEAGNPKILH